MPAWNGGNWQRAYAVRKSIQNQAEPRLEGTNSHPGAAGTPTPNDQDPLPDTFGIFLEPAALRPEVKAGFPPELHHGLRFYAGVTREQYLRLTGAAAGCHRKDRLAVERESAEGFPIHIMACAVVAEYGGWWYLQMQLIRHFLNEAGIEYPQKEAEIQQLARSPRELTCRALLFLLQLARDYSSNPFELIRDNFAQALAAGEPPLALEDFAWLPDLPTSADCKRQPKGVEYRHSLGRVHINYSGW